MNDCFDFFDGIPGATYSHEDEIGRASRCDEGGVVMPARYDWGVDSTERFYDPDDPIFIPAPVWLEPMCPESKYPITGTTLPYIKIDVDKTSKKEIDKSIVKKLIKSGEINVTGEERNVGKSDGD